MLDANSAKLFKKFLTDNWDNVIEDITDETGVDSKQVFEVLHSLKCYILSTYSEGDSGENCVLEHQKN